MDGYEIVKRNISFDYPERIGLRFSALGVSDVFRIFVQPPMQYRPAEIKSVRMDKKIRTAPGQTDEWGCTWESLEDGSSGDMGQVLNPPIKDLDEVDSYSFPDPYDPHHFDGLEEALANADNKFVQLNSPFCLFERLHFLHGFSETLRDLALEPEKMERLIDKVIAYQIGIVEMAGKLGKGRIHCFDTTDDWGTQINMFISPRMWRKIFKPRYKKLLDTIHENGMVIRFHSDGRINAIFPDLLELGVDIFNVHQPLLVGIDDVAEALSGKLCLEVSADVQQTLPSNDEQKIKNQVKEIVEKWCSPKGGLIGIEYRYGKLLGISDQALQWELDAFQKYGKFK